MNPTYPIHPDIEFNLLSFFIILGELVKPSPLMTINDARQQEFSFYFHLTSQQATEIAASRDVRHGNKADYRNQIQMRFCRIENTSKQNDCFPPGLVLRVNNKVCALPNAVQTNTPGVEPKRPPRPMNITELIKLSPVSSNCINVQWAPDVGKAYAITVNYVRKQTSSELLERLKSRGIKPSEHTRGIIMEKLNEDADGEIATTSLRVSLMCPLGKMRMANPCRARTCRHLQCFDALLYLQMNERKPTWNCPVCDEPAVYDDLDIDGYFQDVLNSSLLGADTNDILLNKDGSWSINQSETKNSDSQIGSLDDSDDAATSSTADESKIAPLKRSVVDLTLSDSDDDLDEPLPKKRAPNDTTGASYSGYQSELPLTPGRSLELSSRYPTSSRGVITLVDSPSPPARRQSARVRESTRQSRSAQQAAFSLSSVPMLDLEDEATSPENYYN